MCPEFDFGDPADYWRNASVDDVHRMLEGGADIRARDNSGEAPLHKAVMWSKDLAVISLLIERGAYIEARNYVGDTPLHVAASHAQKSMDGSTAGPWSGH